MLTSNPSHLSARNWAAILSAVLVLFLLAGRASAHAVLLETRPGADASITEAPAEIVLRFNEPVSPISLRIIDGSGRQVTGTGNLSVIDSLLRLPLKTSLAEGSYIVSYRVTSLDSHPVAASFVFSVGKTAANTGVTALREKLDRQTASPVPAYLNRIVHYGALLLAAGMGLFTVLFSVPGPIAATVRRGLSLTALVGIASSVLTVGLGGLELSGSGIDQLLSAAAWSTGARSSLATSAAVAIFGLATLLAGVRLGSRLVGKILVAGGSVLAIASMGFTGHAAQAQPVWLMTPTVMAHCLTAAFWFGALWPLTLVLDRCPAADAVALLRRFSVRAVVAVAILTVASVALTIVQMQRTDAFLTTDYGLTLTAKIVLVGLLLVLAAANKWRYVPALSRGQDLARRRLCFTVRTEIILAAAVVAAAAGLGSVPPPRSLAAAAAPGPHAFHHTAATTLPQVRRNITSAEGITLNIVITPGQTGTNRMELRFRKPDLVPIDPLEVVVSWSHRAAGIEPLEQRAKRVRRGGYLLAGAPMTVPGDWDLRIDALIDDFNKVIFRTVVPVDAQASERAVPTAHTPDSGSKMTRH